MAFAAPSEEYCGEIGRCYLLHLLSVSMRWPLRYQILFPFAGLFLTVIVTITAVNTYWAARASERQMEAQLRTVAQTLQASWYPLTDAVLRQTSGLSGTQFVVSTTEGQVLAASLPVERLKLAQEPTTSWRNLKLQNRQIINGETYFHATLNLTRRGDGAAAGLLHILYPQRNWEAARWQAMYPPLAVGAISLVAVGMLAIAIAAKLSKPIQNLREQVHQLALGDFQTVSLPTQNDELRDLMDSVNHLAGQLDEMRRVIKRTERLTLLGQLSGGLAHHLRNDVTGARMAIQLHETECPSQDAETLSVALRQLTLAEQHLQQFLAAGQPRPPQRAPCNVSELLESVVLLVGPKSKHHGVTIQTSIVPLPSSYHSFEADAEQLRQALLNLTLNAIEAAGSGGWVRIDCSCPDSRNLLFRVIDSGGGVSEQIRAHLFEPFITSKLEGVGLGLAVARQIAEAHGGTLRYTRDKETCFEVLLPLEGISASIDSSDGNGMLNQLPQTIDA